MTINEIACKTQLSKSAIHTGIKWLSIHGRIDSKANLFDMRTKRYFVRPLIDPLSNTN